MVGDHRRRSSTFQENTGTAPLLCLVAPPRFRRKRRLFPDAFRGLRPLRPGRDLPKICREAQTCVFGSATPRPRARACTAGAGQRGAVAPRETLLFSCFWLGEDHHLPAILPGRAAKGRCSRRPAAQPAITSSCLASGRPSSGSLSLRLRSFWRCRRRAADQFPPALLRRSFHGQCGGW